MDVQIKIILQGGHSWEFCCDEDDPLVFGLVSALPGANVGGPASPDGLVQVAARGGERIYLPRQSLVAVQIAPLTSDVPAGQARRFAIPTAGFTGGMSAPAPFAIVADAVSRSLHQNLLDHACAQGEADSAGEGAPSFGLGPLDEAVRRAFTLQWEKCHAAFGLPGPSDVHFVWRIFALGQAQALPTEVGDDDVATLIYHFHKPEKAFTGGGMRLFDQAIEPGAQRATATFRDIELGDNGLLAVPADTLGVGLPVFCTSTAFGDKLFVLRGAVRRGSGA